MKTAVAALALLGVPALANLGKPVLFKDGLSPHVNAKFLANMPPTKSTHSKWDWGWIPKKCAQEANYAKPPLSLYDFEVYNVKYNDCSEPWIMCRHLKAELSLSNMIDLFGRLPVHERQVVSHLVAVPATTPGSHSAYTRGPVITFQGNTASISVFQHEVGHAVDAYNNKDGRSSSQQVFMDAVNQDTCVPDAYSNTNVVEDWTQVSVLLMYNIVVPGGLDTIGANVDCLASQLFVVAYRQQAAMKLGGTCTSRQPNGDVISMGPASGNNKRAIGPKPKMTLVPGHPLVVVHDIDVEITEVTVFEDLAFNETEDALAAERQAAWNAEAKRRAIKRTF